MQTRGTRAGRAVAPWIVAAAVLAASLALLPSARSRAAHALERAGRACLLRDPPPPLAEEHYVALARRYFEHARDANRAASERLAAAEIAWAATALSRTDLLGEAFDAQFDELLAWCEELPEERGFLALALSAIRDHREQQTAAARGGGNPADALLLESLAAVHEAVDPDNGAVPLFLAGVALEARRPIEAQDLLVRAACAPRIDEQLARRARLAEELLVKSGVEPLVARDFLVRVAFHRTGARAGAGFVAVADGFAPFIERDDTRLTLARVAERVAASALLRADARAAAELAHAARAAPRPSERGQSRAERAQADARRWLERSNGFLRPVRGIHDLAIAFAVVFALAGSCVRGRRVEPGAAARRRRGAGAMPAVATGFALAAPFFTLAALRMSEVWPFEPGTRFVDVVCAPHPALLLLPLAAAPFAVFVGFVARESDAGSAAAVRRLLFTLAFALALGFTWTCSAMDSIDAQSARELAELVQTGAAGPSSE